MKLGTAGRTPRQRGHRPLGDHADPDSESLEETSAEVLLQFIFSSFQLTLEDPLHLSQSFISASQDGREIHLTPSSQEHV